MISWWAGKKQRSSGHYRHGIGKEQQLIYSLRYSLHATAYPWEHEKLIKTFDHQSLRRGFQVYREVCSSCHSLQRIPYRSAVGVMMTADEAKALAEENEYDTEPNDEGEIEKRPGKLSDYLPSPYKNDEAARAANNGALPPDLSLIVKARHGGCNYIFSLLTGYPEEPPAGAVVQSGLNFNPYFPGTGIAMARVLYDGLVEYEDGTAATTSQMAKDVVEFLNWAAEPEMDDRKRMGWKVMAIGSTLFAISVWVKRCVHCWYVEQVGMTANIAISGTVGPPSRPEESCTTRQSQATRHLFQARLSGDREVIQRAVRRCGRDLEKRQSEGWHVQQSLTLACFRRVSMNCSITDWYLRPLFCATLPSCWLSALSETYTQ